MSSTDNGKQQITFRYQQEGTAKSFNKLIHGVIPTGVISGGLLIKYTDSVVNISPIDMVISDGSTYDNVTVHVRTKENAEVVVDKNKPFVVATFNWEELGNNYVTFESCSYVELASKPNSLILGKCEFSGDTLEKFDYTYKTWSSSYYNNDFLWDTNFSAKCPSFHVTPFEGTNTIGFVVGRGKAIIDGKEIEVSEPQSIILQNTDASDHLYIDLQLQNNYKRIDIAILRPADNLLGYTIDYVMGEPSATPITPEFPSNGLVLAKFTYPTGNISKIYGSYITNIYNNNYICGKSTVGQKVGAYKINQNTLYI